MKHTGFKRFSADRLHKVVDRPLLHGLNCMADRGGRRARLDPAGADEQIDPLSPINVTVDHGERVMLFCHHPQGVFHAIGHISHHALQS